MILGEGIPGRKHAMSSRSSREVRMVYKVVLHQSEEGYSVSIPGLPGCCSQGATEAEALENITDAIRDYLEVAAELAEAADGEVRQVEVAG
jgi:predicted RNase H-like HicB family nuclease